MQLVDLRSDTVTQPTPAMRQAMLEAEVGDDVYDEDPTVNALQAESAALLGMEASLFVPSGTMANQLALKAHTQGGDVVMAHSGAHIVCAESAAGALLAGIQFHYADGEGGLLDLDAICNAYQTGENPHFAPTTLICLENTHNFSGGTPVSSKAMQPILALAAEKGVNAHLDGARLCNAAVALDTIPKALVKGFQSSTLCFSKGLGAPMGSVVAGSKAFIGRCKRYRKMYGGGMRQIGFAAAAARYALAHHVERLSQDHTHATALAQGLANLAGVKLVKGMPKTNMVFLQCTKAGVSNAHMVAALAEHGVKIGALGPYQARMVTHLHIDQQAIDYTLGVFQKVLG